VGEQSRRILNSDRNVVESGTTSGLSARQALTCVTERASTTVESIGDRYRIKKQLKKVGLGKTQSQKI